MRRCPTPQAGPGTSGRNWDPQQHGCVLGMGQCWGAPLLFVGKLVWGRKDRHLLLLRSGVLQSLGNTRKS